MLKLQYALFEYIRSAWVYHNFKESAKKCHGRVGAKFTQNEYHVNVPKC